MHFFSAVKKAEAFLPGAQLERDDVTFLARRKFPFLTGITVFENYQNCLIYKNSRGWCEACGDKLASLAFEEHSNVNETFCEIFKLVWVIGEKEGGMEEDVCVIAKLTSSSTWRWNEIECQSSGHF